MPKRNWFVRVLAFPFIILIAALGVGLIIVGKPKLPRCEYAGVCSLYRQSSAVCNGEAEMYCGKHRQLMRRLK